VFVSDINNSRAVLVEVPEPEEYYLDRYREREVRRTGKRVRRAHSDVTLHSTRRPKNRKQRGETPFEKSSNSRESDDKRSQDSRDGPRQSRESRDSQAGREHRGSQDRLDDHRGSREGRAKDARGSRDDLDRHPGRRDRTTVVDVHKPKKQAPAPPQQKPKREERQSVEYSDPELGESATDSAKLRAIERERERAKEKELGLELDKMLEKDNRAYVHDEDLHIRPYSYEGKPVQQTSTKYENSVVAKMAALTETPKATYIRPAENVQSRDIPQSFHAEVTKKLETLQTVDGPLRSLDTTEGPVATSTGKHSRASRPNSAREQRRSRRGSNVTDADGMTFLELKKYCDMPWAQNRC